MVSLRRGLPGGLVALSVTLVVGGTGPAGHAAETTPAGPAPRDAAAAPRWDRLDRGVTAAPADVVAEAPARGAVRVVTLRSIGGRPVVDVRTVPGRAAAARAVEDAQKLSGVVSVELDTRVRLAAAPRSNDPHRAQQWGLDRLKAEDVAARQTGAGVTVAVIDTGVQGDHPDLAGAVLPGVNVPTGGADSSDADGHGTHVAGIVGAVANNGVGVAGLASGVKILPVRVMDDAGVIYGSSVIEGIVYAVDHGASVINLSLGSDTSTDAEAAAVQYALDRNVTVVASAGNSAQEGNPTNYPAAHPGVIGVGASDPADRIAAFSNHGSYVDVAAPGVDILSTYPSSVYAEISGTSMAAPFVAAAAALLKAADPALTPAQVAAALQSTATDLGAAGRDDHFGHGLIDPSAALCAVTNCSGAASTVTEILGGSATLRYGNSVTGTARVRDAIGGAGLGGVPVQVCTSAAPAKVFSCRAYTSDSGGQLPYQLAPRANTNVYVAHPGAAGTNPSRSATIRYTVVPRVTMSKGRGTINASVAMDRKSTVVLEKWTGKRWAKARSVSLRPRQGATFGKLTAGRYRLRVPATATLGATVTAPVALR